MGRRKRTSSLFRQRIRRRIIFYYELDIDLCGEEYPQYVYDKSFDYFLSAISTRVFETQEDTLYVVTGDQTYYCLDPKEATLIMLSAIARPKKLYNYNYFDPGHA